MRRCVLKEYESLTLMNKKSSVAKSTIIILAVCYAFLVLFVFGLIFFIFKQLPISVIILFFLCLLLVPYSMLIGFGKGATYIPIGPIFSKMFKKRK